MHVVWLHEYHYLCASLNIDIKHIRAIIYIGSCAELKKAQKQYEREETEVCACMYLYMNVYDSVNCRQPVLVKILVQVQELPLPRYIYSYIQIQIKQILSNNPSRVVHPRANLTKRLLRLNLAKVQKRKIQSVCTCIVLYGP